MRLLSFVLLLLQVVTQSSGFGPGANMGWEAPCREGSCTYEPRSSYHFDDYGEYVEEPTRATGHFYEGLSSTAAHPDRTSGYGPGESENHLDRFPGSHTSLGLGTDITHYNGDLDSEEAAELAAQLSLDEFRAGRLSRKHPPDFTWVVCVVVLHFFIVFWNKYLR